MFLLFTVFIILNVKESKSVLQSNGNTIAKYNLSDWIMNARNMETLGGGMGLSEKINNDLTFRGNSNNIDVHMQKNTEYGALVILSASSYGNPNKVKNGDTTTGNITGAVMNINSEWVVAGTELNPATNFANATQRYKNIYGPFPTNYVAKNGDATIQTNSWHGSNSVLINCDGYSIGRPAGMIRSYSNSIFDYYYGGPSNGITDYKNLLAGRAVIVSGDGL